MGLRQRGKVWYVRQQTWNEFGSGGLMRSTGTSNKTLARDMEYELKRERQRGDPKGMVHKIAAGQLDISVWFRNRNGVVPLTDEAVVANRLSLRVLYERWLTWMESPNTVNKRGTPYGARTIHRYINSWNRFFEHLPANPKLNDLTQTFLRKYQAARTQAARGVSGHVGKGPLSASAWNNDMTAFQAFVRWCEDECDHTLPKFKVIKRKQPKKIVRWLDTDELAAVEDHCSDDWWMMFALMIGTGLRFIEASVLRPCDFKHGEVIVRDSKTRAGTRRVPVSPRLSRFLVKYINRHNVGMRSELFVNAYDDPSEGSSRPGYELWRNRWVLVTEAAGVEATMHDLRDTFAVWQRKAGTSIADLKDLLGHETLHMTMKYADYGMSAEERKAATDRMSDLMWGKPQGVGTAVDTRRKAKT